MKQRTYTKYSTHDFIFFGRLDAWDEDIIKESRINEIIEILLTKLEQKETLERIKNYLIGYKIGMVEKLLSEIEGNVLFNFKNQEFIDRQDMTKTSFKAGYQALEKEASKEAVKILKIN